MKPIMMIFCLFLSFSAFAKNNFHLLQRGANGFAIFRASIPDAKDMKMFCDMGITEMMVLSGTAAKAEFKYQAHCPTLKVIYNTKQSARTPLNVSFLNEFDSWVAKAKQEGKKIAFRCECGCHRTGRLAAYYQMKYQHLTLVEAWTQMDEDGRWMFLFPELYPQVQALQDHINGDDCSVANNFCVVKN